MFAALVAPAAIAGAYATADARAPRSTVVACWIVVVALSVGLVGRSVGARDLRRAGGRHPEVAVAAAWSRCWRRSASSATSGRPSRAPGSGSPRATRPGAARATPGRSCACSWTRSCRGATSGAPRRSRRSGRASPPTSTRRCCRRSAARSSRRSPAGRWSGWRRTCDRRWRRSSRCSSSRRSIVLEEMGLRAAIEWLAERIEDRSDVRVEIEVEGDNTVVGEAVTRPPRDAERAAFRVAQLALDNVVRHVPEGVAVVTIAVAPARDPAPDRGRRHEPPRSTRPPRSGPGDAGSPTCAPRPPRAAARSRWAPGRRRARDGRSRSTGGSRRPSR